MLGDTTFILHDSMPPPRGKLPPARMACPMGDFREARWHVPPTQERTGANPPPQGKLAYKPKHVTLAPRFPCIYVTKEVGPPSRSHDLNKPSWPPRSWPRVRTSHLGRGQLPLGVGEGYDVNKGTHTRLANPPEMGAMRGGGVLGRERRPLLVSLRSVK